MIGDRTATLAAAADPARRVRRGREHPGHGSGPARDDLARRGSFGNDEPLELYQVRADQQQTFAPRPALDRKDASTAARFRAGSQAEHGLGWIGDHAARERRERHARRARATSSVGVSLSAPPSPPSAEPPLLPALRRIDGRRSVLARAGRLARAFVFFLVFFAAAAAVVGGLLVRGRGCGCLAAAQAARAVGRAASNAGIPRA